MNSRQLRLEAAHRELGSRHPWLTIFGRPAGGALGVLVFAAVLVWAGGRLWHAVSGWAAPDRPTVSAPVSETTGWSVSAMPWWGWAVLAIIVLVVVLALVVRFAGRLVFRIRWGIWPSY